MTDLIKALRERTGTIGAGLITAENTPLTTSWDAAANPTLVSHGDKAQAKGVGGVDELATTGDDAGAAVWRRITYAISQLQITIPAGPLPFTRDCR